MNDAGYEVFQGELSGLWLCVVGPETFVFNTREEAEAYGQKRSTELRETRH